MYFLCKELRKNANEKTQKKKVNMEERDFERRIIPHKGSISLVMAEI